MMFGAKSRTKYWADRCCPPQMLLEIIVPKKSLLRYNDS